MQFLVIKLKLDNGKLINFLKTHFLQIMLSFLKILIDGH